MTMASFLVPILEEINRHIWATIYALLILGIITTWKK